MSVATRAVELTVCVERWFAIAVISKGRAEELRVALCCRDLPRDVSENGGANNDNDSSFQLDEAPESSILVECTYALLSARIIRFDPTSRNQY